MYGDTNVQPFGLIFRERSKRTARYIVIFSLNRSTNNCYVNDSSATCKFGTTMQSWIALLPPAKKLGGYKRHCFPATEEWKAYLNSEDTCMICLRVAIYFVGRRGTVKT
jgi:hypothetical protein